MITCTNVTPKKQEGILFKDLPVGVFFVTCDSTEALLFKISCDYAVIVAAELVVDVLKDSFVYRISSMEIEYSVDYKGGKNE